MRLTQEQIEAWNRVSPETVIGNPACNIGEQEALADAREALEDILDYD